METPPCTGNAKNEIWWRLIETFNPAKHNDSYLFADECNVFMGHWYEGEPEPRLSYTGQGGNGDFPITPLYWMPVPLAPEYAKAAAVAESNARTAKMRATKQPA